MEENKKYEKAYSEEDFWEKISGFAKKMGAVPLENALKLYYAMNMGKATIPQIAAIVAALGYFISPFDFISDFLPGGWIDDATVLATAVATLACCSEPDVVKAARNKVGEWFNIDEIIDSADFYFRKKFWGKEMKMVVLGKEEAGKTSFYNFLKDGDPGTPSQTPVEDEIKGFDVVDSENHIMSICSVKDINGHGDYVAKYYRELVTANDVILFLFNANNFVSDKEYREDVIDRIALISIYADDKMQKTLHIVPTFRDEAIENGITDESLKRILLDSLNSDSKAKEYADSSNILSMYQTNDVNSLTDLRDTIFSAYRNKA